MIIICCVFWRSLTYFIEFYVYMKNLLSIDAVYRRCLFLYIVNSWVDGGNLLTLTLLPEALQ